MLREIKKMKAVAILSFFLLGLCFGVSAVAQDALPKAGLTIDKSNIDTYKQFFPEIFLDAFTTGWDLIEPLSITLKDPVENPIPQVFLDASEKNKGKYSLDAEGYMVGGAHAEIVGLPFPDITPADKDFVVKFMWNYDYRYKFDDMVSTFINYEKRKGSAMTTSVVESWQVSFQNRMFDDPKPLYQTTTGTRSVNFLLNLYPAVQKNFITLLIRNIDQKESDTTYLYLPSMRRVLRGEAGQRSTPINSSTQAPDDFEGGFSGRIPEFTYTLVGEQKLIVLGDSRLGYTQMKDGKYEKLPVEKENWMVKDVYVIDITPKDAKYPQGKKRLWVDKTNYSPYYAAAWDRANALWKVWQTAINVQPMAAGGTVPYFTGMLGLDIQLGYGVQMFADWKANGNNITEADVSVNAMRKKAR